MATPASPQAWGLPSTSAEVLGKRSQHAKHFQNADGTFTAILRRNLHYHTNGSWEEVDTSFVMDGSDFVTKATPIQTLVSSTWPGIQILDPASGKGLRWFQTGLAVIGNEVQYYDTSITWAYRPHAYGVKLEGTVTAPQGAKTYTHTVGAQGGVTLSVDAYGGLVADSVHVPRVTVLRADGIQEDASPWQVNGNRVSYSYDDSHLPAEAYPYIIDPTTTINVGASADDGVVTSTTTGTTYPPPVSSASTSGTSIIVQRTFTSGTNRYSLNVGLLKFDTSSLGSGTTITSASLILHGTTATSVDSRSIYVEYYNAANWPIDTSDYTTTASNTAGSLPISSWAANADNTISLTSPDTNINKTGSTGFRLHVSGGQPTGINNYSFGTYDTGPTPAPSTLSITYTTNVTVSPTGIASAEALGTPALSMRISVSPSGVASGEAFGTAALSTTITVTATGIATAEALGTPALQNLNTLSPSGIASEEAFGTPFLDNFLHVVGIASEEAFGTPAMSNGLTLEAVFIDSAEAMGTPTLSASITLTVPGIVSAEAFGTFIASLTPHAHTPMAFFINDTPLQLQLATDAPLSLQLVNDNPYVGSWFVAESQ